MKIWAKVMQGDKIKKDVIYESELALTPSNFQKMLQEIAYRVDIGSIVLQNGINGLGTDIISAHTAARKIFSFTIMPFSAISATLVTFVSQNLGAGKFDRIKKSIKYGLLIGYGWSTLAVLLVYLFGEQLVLMIAPARSEERRVGK